MIISSAATAPQPEQPSDSLPWTPISACLWINASHYLSSLYRSTQSALPPCCSGCGNMLWQKLQHTHTANTSTHILYITYVSTTLPLAPTLRPPPSHRHTQAQIHTHLLRPSNTSDPEPRLTAKAGWVMNQGEDQRRVRDRWAKASSARWCLLAKANKSLAWQKPCQRRSELSFYLMIMIVLFF